MDFLFISMPYARFISKWFANVPNINLGIMQSFLRAKGKSVKTFHFHLEFLSFVEKNNLPVTGKFIRQTEQFGVEFMGLDYIFASLLLEEKYLKSKDLFSERLESTGLNLRDFEEMRVIARSFIESVSLRLLPYLGDTTLVGFSCSHYQLSSSLLLCSKIKNIYPNIKTILGGKDCSGNFAYDLLKHFDFIDFVGTGECEVTVNSLLEHIADNGKDFYNVLFRGQNGEIKHSSSILNISLDSLPFPEYDFSDFPVNKGDIILPIEFGRGCPWKKCTFCPDESYNIRCQAKSAERLKEEFAYYQDISGDLRNFFILDSDALKNRRAIIEMSKFLEPKNLNFIYAEFRAEKMDKEILRAIMHFGNWTSNFQVGIETFSERLLQLMNKGVPALKNVQVLKAAAELGAPIQFNLFTCFPRMTEEDMKENLRVMDSITHILVSENIQIYPGEFYLPTDCPVFLNIDRYGLKKHSDNIFSLVFENLGMPSYSNYPYPYQFDNDDDQFVMSGIIRKKLEEIKSKNSEDTSMVYTHLRDGLQVDIHLNGRNTSYTLLSREKDIYVSAIEEVQQVLQVSEKLGIPFEEVVSVLNDLEQKGLILYSTERNSFLSLAMPGRDMR